MKKCLVCGLENQEGMSCSACGEASWMEQEPQVQEPVFEQEEPAKVPVKRGRPFKDAK